MSSGSVARRTRHSNLNPDGLTLGLAGGALLTRLIAKLLFGISPNDPITFVSVSILLAVVALAASYIPARRATRVDPVIGLGFAPTLTGAVVCLALAGAADTVSGIFRQTIWNETIPGQLRGRLAGVEMISYLSGPLLGNARAGWVTSISSNMFSVVSGGVTYFAGVLLCIPILPAFWLYRRAR